VIVEEVAVIEVVEEASPVEETAAEQPSEKPKRSRKKAEES